MYNAVTRPLVPGSCCDTRFCIAHKKAITLPDRSTESLRQASSIDLSLPSSANSRQRRGGHSTNVRTLAIRDFQTDITSADCLGGNRELLRRQPGGPYEFLEALLFQLFNFNS